jgi:hypothetical protein
MKLSASIQVEINELQKAQIARNFLYEKLEKAELWHKDYFIYDDYVQMNVEYAGSHKWTQTIKVRPATEKDKFWAELFNSILTVK